MLYNFRHAIETMNQWGSQRIPFLFFIDFEMKAIQLYRTDIALPSHVAFAFPTSAQNTSPKKVNKKYHFRKYPVSFIQYQQAFAESGKQIRAGNTFLLNLTFPTMLETNLTIREIYEYSWAKYKILVEGEFVCFSPETFVTIRDGYIASYPMKGTIKASVPEAAEKILNNSKETAEHHTIVDLIRNDLSMVATDVTVKRFRYVDRIATSEGDILQVSSEIIGKLPENYNNNLGNIIFTLLPAGSVTGAPKHKTIEIIRSIEKTERGYYTGICGHFDGQNLDSAVMIRFIEVQDDETLWFRSGGGITCNSDLESEYHELIDKVYVPFV
jgi:para-aminobenzoate synthetase component 1